MTASVLFGLSGQQVAQDLLTGAVGILVAVIGYVLNRKTHEIHVLVNSQTANAMKRIADLEQKLGLTAGETIPGPSILTVKTATANSQSASLPNPTTPSNPLPDQGLAVDSLAPTGKGLA